MSRLQRLVTVSSLGRWFKREDHAKELIELAELNTRLTVEMDLVRPSSSHGPLYAD